MNSQQVMGVPVDLYLYLHLHLYLHLQVMGVPVDSADWSTPDVIVVEPSAIPSAQHPKAGGASGVSPPSWSWGGPTVMV